MQEQKQDRPKTRRFLNFKTPLKSMSEDKTRFEQVVELGLHAIDLELDQAKGKGDQLDAQFFPKLHPNFLDDPPFYSLRVRTARTDSVRVEYILAVQNLGRGETLPSVEEALKQEKLYEILSVWLIPPQGLAPLSTPNFEFTARVNKWYIDSQDSTSQRQPYDPNKMTQRTLNAIRGRLRLPEGGTYDVLDASEI